jgi:uncharacterized protein
MTPPNSTDPRLPDDPRTWLTTFAEGVPAVGHAVLASRAGLVLACSPGLDRTTGDRFAAVIVPLFTMSSGAARAWERGVCEHVVVRTGGGAILVLAAGAEACLGVVAGPEADLAAVARQAHLLAVRLGEGLSPHVVAGLQSAAAEAVLGGAR